MNNVGAGRAKNLKSVMENKNTKTLKFRHLLRLIVLINNSNGKIEKITQGVNYGNIKLNKI